MGVTVRGKRVGKTGKSVGYPEGGAAAAALSLAYALARREFQREVLFEAGTEAG